LSRWTEELVDMLVLSTNQRGSQRRNTFRDGQSRAPLVSENVQADASVGVDVGVVDTCGEVHLGRLEGVVGGEVNRKEEDTAGVRGVRLRFLVSQNVSCLLVEDEDTDAPACG
jgi:hypothetical protein